jgi:hypothetical protein
VYTRAFTFFQLIFWAKEALMDNADKTVTAKMGTIIFFRDVISSS